MGGLRLGQVMRLKAVKAENCPACMICCEETCNEHISLPCGHEGGRYCLEKWFHDKTERVCPVCRRNYGVGVPELPFPDLEHPEGYMTGLNQLAWLRQTKHSAIFAVQAHIRAMDMFNTGKGFTPRVGDDRAILCYDTDIWKLLSMARVLQGSVTFTKKETLQWAMIVKSIADVLAHNENGAQGSMRDLKDALENAFLARLEELARPEDFWRNVFGPVSDWDLLNENTTRGKLLEQLIGYVLSEAPLMEEQPRFRGS